MEEDLLSEGLFDSLGKFFLLNLPWSIPLVMLGEANLEAMFMAKEES